MFLITFSEGNGRAELQKNTFNDALLCDDEAHIVVLCTCQGGIFPGSQGARLPRNLQAHTKCWQKFTHYHKHIFSSARNFLPQEEISCHKKIFRGEVPSRDGTGDMLQQLLHKCTKSFMRISRVLLKTVLRVFCFKVIQGCI